MNGNLGRKCLIMMNKCVVCCTVLNGQKQKYCSNECKQKDHYHRVKMQTNTYHSQTLRSLKCKLTLIEMFGGSCERCGYNNNAAALHFHHKQSGTKPFKLDMRILSNKRWDPYFRKQQNVSCFVLIAMQKNIILN